MPGEPPTATVTTALPCIGCGYNLRGLDEAGSCPECGRAVEATREQLVHGVAAGPARQRVAAGLLVLIMSLAATLVSPLLGAIAFAGFDEPALALWGLWIAAEHLLWIAGVWMATGKGDTEIPKEQARSRGIARAAAGVNGLLMFTLLGLFTATASFSPGDEYLVATVFVAPLIGLARAASIWWLGADLLLSGAAGFARRGPASIRRLRAVGLWACLAFAAAFPLVFAGGVGIVVYIGACVVLWINGLAAVAVLSGVRTRLLHNRPVPA